VRQLQTVRVRQVSRQGDVAAAIADDAHPAAAREMRHQQALSELDHLARRRDPLDAAGPTRGIDSNRGADQGAGMRAGRAGAARRGADGEEDHRLTRLQRAQRRSRKRTTIAKILGVDGDDLRGVVAGEALDELGHVQIRLVTDRDEPRESEAGLPRDRRELKPEVPALRDQTDRAPRKVAEGHVQPGSGVCHAEAVRADQHRPRGTHPLDDATLDDAPSLIKLSHTRGYADDGPGAGMQRVVHDLLEPRSPDGDDDQIYRLGKRP